MIIKRNTMYDLGFKTMGLDFGSNTSVDRYTKYYDKELYLLVADAYSDSLYGFKFDDKKEMKEFKDNKFSITLDPSQDRRYALGGGFYKFKHSISMNEQLNIHKITRTKHLTDGIKLFENKFINIKKR